MDFIDVSRTLDNIFWRLLRVGLIMQIEKNPGKCQTAKIRRVLKAITASDAEWFGSVVNFFHQRFVKCLNSFAKLSDAEMFEGNIS